MSNSHEQYMRVALDEARKALSCGQFPVGCVIVKDSGIVATGGRENSDTSFSELDHAEIVALRNLQKNRPGIDLSKVTVYSTMEPCLMCYSTMIVNNVHRIVYGYEDAMGGGTNLPLSMLAPLYRDRKVQIIKDVLREECLYLFQEFFRTPGNSYLQDSYLAQYTLSQKNSIVRNRDLS